MRSVLLLVFLGAALLPAEDLPLTGISHVAFRVSDLEKARMFYTNLLGYPEAFRMDRPDGTVGLAFLKVNDEQYIELQPGLKPGEDVRLTHVALVTTDAPRLHRMLTERGLTPGAINAGRDGNRAFRLNDPEGNILEFTEYLAGSLHDKARGRHEEPKRISAHLLHAGIPIRNLEPAMAFYRDKLGFVETWRGGPRDGEIAWVNLRMPGPRGDYVELMLHDGAPNRQRLGSMQHICLQVPDIQASHRTLRERGLADEERQRPRVGRNGRWQLNAFDPDGSRVELMEPKPRP